MRDSQLTPMSGGRTTGGNLGQVPEARSRQRAIAWNLAEADTAGPRDRAACTIGCAGHRPGHADSIATRHVGRAIGAPTPFANARPQKPLY